MDDAGARAGFTILQFMFEYETEEAEERAAYVAHCRWVERLIEIGGPRAGGFSASDFSVENADFLRRQMKRSERNVAYYRDRWAEHCEAA